MIATIPSGTPCILYYKDQENWCLFKTDSDSLSSRTSSDIQMSDLIDIDIDCLGNLSNSWLKENFVALMNKNNPEWVMLILKEYLNEKPV